MADPPRKTQTQEAGCQPEQSVLSEILYLDSPTDYREYLPRVIRPASPPEDKFITLDDVARYDWSLVGMVALIGFLVALLLMLCHI